jgi:hypothetical protein
MCEQARNRRFSCLLILEGLSSRWIIAMRGW